MNPKLIFAGLAVVAGAALADGVPLITAGPPLAANDAARRMDAVALHPIVLNKQAFGANVLTVMIEGKEYRFVGSMMPLRPPLPKAVTQKQPETLGWSGREPDGSTLVLTKNVETGGMLGTIFLLRSNRLFHIATPRGGSTVLVETDANAGPTQVFAAQSAASAASGGTR
jgi:hypothetical protein